MFDLQNGPTFAQLEQLIRGGKLVEYLIGLDEFTPPSLHPQLTYNRWNRLIDYYRDPTTNPNIKQIIQQSLVSMFDSRDLRQQSCSLQLNRILNLEDLRPKLLEFAEPGKLKEQPEPIRSEILYLAKKLRINELEDEWSKLPPSLPGDM